jgi:hypothetical protein
MTASAGAIRPKTAPATQPIQQADAKAVGLRPGSKPEGTKMEASALPPGSQDSGVMAGAQPTIPSGGFENRFGAWQR